jgi:molybdopterin-guanine dinucleotide biosynthesis protein A
MTSYRSDCLGVVLAGGASSRMGQDKASLKWGDGTLLDHICATLAQVCGDVIVSGKPQGVMDEQPLGGPLLAINSVLQQTRTRDYQLVLFCAVDTPFVTVETLACLRDEVQHTSAAHFEHHYLPMALRRNDDVLNTVQGIATMVPASARSMRRLAERLSARVLTLSHVEQLINLNTPELYQRFYPD